MKIVAWQKVHELRKDRSPGVHWLAEKTWWYYYPVWLGGQAIKALVMAAELFDDEKYLKSAEAGAEFVFANLVWDESSPDHGLILAFENFADKVNISVAMEAMVVFQHAQERYLK